MGGKIKALWRKTSWAWSPESDRESSEAIVKNFWLHWFPAKVARASMDWNYSFWLGTASASLLLILTVTGVMLMFFYVPSTERAYGSIKDFQYAVSFGRLLRNQHRWAAEGMVAVVYIHMARVFFTGAYRGPRAINWVVGVVLFLATLFLSFTGYLLPWDQLAFWAITVGTSIAKQAPFVGPTIQFLLLGGHEIGQQTLLRFYVLHVFFLPVFVWMLFAYHMWRVRKDGGLAAVERVRNARVMVPKATPKTKSYSLFGLTPGTSVAVMSSTGLEESDQVFSSPNMSRRIALVFLVVFNLTLLAAILFNAPLEGLANPSVTPNPAKAPWYFVWLQELVASTTVRFGGFTVSGALLGRNTAAGIFARGADAVAVARSFAAARRRTMARARAQASEPDLRRRDARDHHPDHGRRLSARSLLADLLARPGAPRDAAALLTWPTRTNRSRRRTSAGWSRCRFCSWCWSWSASGESSAPNGDRYQRQFPQLLGHYGKGEDARDFQPGIQQIWIPKIGVTDRCITCHLGYEWSSVLPATIAEPLKPHPMNDWMTKHEFAKFGCTPCHGGDGAATTVAGAHQGGRGWDDPMLSNALAAQNGLTMNEMIQMRCNFCHRHDAATPGMDEINLAKVLFKKKKCLLCHVVEARGGATGPELTYEGDRNPELLNFAHVTGEHTMFNWNVQHLTQGERGFAEHRDARFQLQARGIASADAPAAELAAPDVSARVHSRSRSGRSRDATVANVNRDSDSERDAYRALSNSN